MTTTREPAQRKLPTNAVGTTGYCNGETLDYAFGLMVGKYKGSPTEDHAGMMPVTGQM
jgi:hypothetical protein